MNIQKIFLKKTWKYANLWRKGCFFCHFSTKFKGWMWKFCFFDCKQNPNWSNTCKSFILKKSKTDIFFKKIQGQKEGVPRFLAPSNSTFTNISMLNLTGKFQFLGSQTWHLEDRMASSTLHKRLPKISVPYLTKKH